MKFQVEIIQSQKFQVWIDESEWTELAIAKWSLEHAPVYSIRELAQKVAFKIADKGGEGDSHLDGFGHVRICDHRGNELPLPSGKTVNDSISAAYSLPQIETKVFEI